ncbi:MAG: NapC/NirT family cytochrome c, partial [Planctomycetes bacterium]|nr:NapC/NirT family cytochrome c [Planctomycetota bacterium]
MNANEKAGQTPAEPSNSGPEPALREATNDAAPYQPTHRPLWNNLITEMGIFVSAAALLLLLSFGLVTLMTPNPNPYVDIVGYLVVPSTLVIGIALIPLGILFKSWRIHRRHPEQRLAFRFPRVDLNDPAQRRVAKMVVIGTFVLLPVVGVSSYHGYHYTDSASFCAKACHSVMEPQSTTYEHSAHARVACAECHIGSGASWFVKAKLSGTRQVLATWQNSYPRPIPPAIRHLRPARET